MTGINVKIKKIIEQELKKLEIKILTPIQEKVKLYQHSKRCWFF